MGIKPLFGIPGLFPHSHHQDEFSFVFDGWGPGGILPHVPPAPPPPIFCNPVPEHFGGFDLANYPPLVLPGLVCKLPPPFAPRLPDTQLNASLDVATATDGNGHALFGSGNPATGWQVQEAGHNEVGMHIHYRQGDTILPDAVKPNGVLVYHGPDGAQVADPAHHVPAANANRAAVNFDWSFDTGANGPGGQTQQQFLANGGTEQIKIDLDPGAGFKWLWLDAKYDPAHNPNGSHVVWTAHNNTFAAQGIHQGDILVADDAGNTFATQNSTNLAFFNSLIDHDSHVPGIQGGSIAPAGTYDFELIMTNAHHQTIADVHSQIILA